MAKRTDSNQGEVVTAFRQLGYSVAFTHTIGRGFPDICVGKNGRTHLIEIKTRKGQLTPQEDEFHKSWKGSIAIIRGIDDVIAFDKSK